MWQKHSRSAEPAAHELSMDPALNNFPIGRAAAVSDSARERWITDVWRSKASQQISVSLTSIVGISTSTLTSTFAPEDITLLPFCHDPGTQVRRPITELERHDRYRTDQENAFLFFRRRRIDFDQLIDTARQIAIGPGQDVTIRMVLHQMADALEATRPRPGIYAPSFPLTGLAEVIADAMWDSNENRVGGPQAAAAAAEAAGYRLVV
jgi:hypothetical protein